MVDASKPNPSSTMSSPSSSHPIQENPAQIQENPAQIQENPSQEHPVSSENPEVPIERADGGDDPKEQENEDADEEEEEEGECGFCLYMKGGGCRDTFTDWEKCVEEGEKNNEDIVEKCFQVTAALKKCMEVHSDYYAPLLEAEKAAEEEAAKQLEEEKEKPSSDNNQEKVGSSEVSDKKE